MWTYMGVSMVIQVYWKFWKCKISGWKWMKSGGSRLKKSYIIGEHGSFCGRGRKFPQKQEPNGSTGSLLERNSSSRWKSCLYIGRSGWKLLRTSIKVIAEMHGNLVFMGFYFTYMEASIWNFPSTIIKTAVCFLSSTSIVVQLTADA